MYTPEQQRCLDITDRNIIVSAGAGTGKTHTLIGRIFELMTRDENPVEIDQLMVVTFTRAAASEMKVRLEKSLHAAVSSGDLSKKQEKHLRQQMYLLPRARISTLHSFCLDLITSHSREARISPGFDLMSEQEDRLLHHQFLKDKIDEVLSRPEEDATRSVVTRVLDQLDTFTGPDQLRQQIYQLQVFLSTMPNPEFFVEEATDAYFDNEPSALAMKLSEEFLRNKLEDILSEYEAFRPDTSDWQVKTKEDYFAFRGFLKQLRDCIESDSIQENYVNFLKGYEVPRYPSGKKTQEEDNYKVIRKSLQSDLKKLPQAEDLLITEKGMERWNAGKEICHVILKDCALRWLNELYQTYIDSRRINFSLLEHLALKILSPNGEPSTVAQSYQRQFEYILVDEFQDINATQQRVISSVARPPENGNLFIVGDIKQSIYRFRRADPSIFLGIYDKARKDSDEGKKPEWTGINLTRNFRSNPSLLLEMNRLFVETLREDVVGIDYTDGHEFIPGGDEKALPTQVHLSLFKKEMPPKEEHGDSSTDAEEDQEDDYTEEAKYIAKVIREKGPPWNQYAILLRSAVGSVVQLAEALKEYDIPFFTESKLGFLTAVEILEFQGLLKFINNPYDDQACLSALRGPAFRLSEEDIFALRIESKKDYFIDIVRNLAVSNPDHQTRPLAILSQLEKWQEASSRASMGQFLQNLIDEIHLLDSAMVRPAGEQRERNLLQILQYAYQFDQFQVKGLDQFLSFLDELLEEGEDFATPTPPSGDQDVVRIMSIHKSKGLEFPVVIYPFLGKEFNKRDAQKPFLLDESSGIATKYLLKDDPENEKPLPYQILQSTISEKSLAEELRLIYVALTRAECQVYMSATLKSPAKKLAEVSEIKSSSDKRLRYLKNAKCPGDVILTGIAPRIPALPDNLDTDPFHHQVNEFRLNVYPDESYLDQFEQQESEQVDLFSGFDTSPYLEALHRIKEHDSNVSFLSARAKISVSEVKRAFEAERDSETPPFRISSQSKDSTPDWIPSRFLRQEKKKGAERGQAIHRFLALCDIHEIAYGRRRLSEELDRLINESLLTEEQGKMIDLYALQWFFNGDLGKRLRVESARLHRERAFTISLKGEEIEGAPAHQHLIFQGVVDVLFQEDNSWVIVDYKTDYCGENLERLPSLKESYSTQLQLYQLLVERTLGQPVKECWLSFLHPKENYAVPRLEEAKIPWEEIVRSGVYISTEPNRSSQQGNFKQRNI